MPSDFQRLAEELYQAGLDDGFRAGYIQTLKAALEKSAVDAPDLHLKLARTQALDDAAKFASGMMLDLGHAYAYRHLPSAIRDLSDKPSGTASFFQDVVNLVIAAREFWDVNNDLTDESRALDKALEAFTDTVPYENQPDDISTCDEENN